MQNVIEIDLQPGHTLRIRPARTTAVVTVAVPLEQPATVCVQGNEEENGEVYVFEPAAIAPAGGEA